MAKPTLSERVAALEAEVSELKNMRTAAPVPETPWWKRIVGIYRNDPLFDEAERLGREYRQAQRPPDEGASI